MKLKKTRCNICGRYKHVFCYWCLRRGAVFPQKTMRLMIKTLKRAVDLYELRDPDARTKVS